MGPQSTLIAPDICPTPPTPAVLAKKDEALQYPSSSPGSDFIFCPRDAKCGKIQCQSSQARPLESNAVPIDTTIIMNGRQIQCRGTHVYRRADDDEEEEGDMLDPGLVLTGTKCGDNHVSSYPSLTQQLGCREERLRSVSCRGGRWTQIPAPLASFIKAVER